MIRSRHLRLGLVLGVGLLAGCSTCRPGILGRLTGRSDDCCPPPVGGFPVGEPVVTGPSLPPVGVPAGPPAPVAPVPGPDVLLPQNVPQFQPPPAANGTVPPAQPMPYQQTRTIRSGVRQ